MNSQLVRKVGEMTVDNLINSTYPPPETTGVLIRAGQGQLPRGAVLALSSSGNDTVLLGTAADGDETLTASFVLADSVDASGAEAVPAVAYRTGHFNRPALIVAEAHTLTRGEEEALRYGGILMSDAL